MIEFVGKSRPIRAKRLDAGGEIILAAIMLLATIDNRFQLVERSGEPADRSVDRRLLHPDLLKGEVCHADLPCCRNCWQKIRPRRHLLIVSRTRINATPRPHFAPTAIYAPI